jgi:hypothetical protein
VATYQQYSGAGGTILVEVTPGSTVSNAGELASLIAPIRDLAAALGSQLGAAPEATRPTELEVSFGIGALADGRVAIVLGGTQASTTHLQVLMRWKASSGFDVPTGDIPL